MNFKEPRGKPEKRASEALVDLMQSHGWVIKRLNVSAGNYSTPGWPDYFAAHHKHGPRWIEMKIKGGSLEESQIKFCTDFAAVKVGVWILTGPNDYKLLFEEPNWWQYCMRGKIR